MENKEEGYILKEYKLLINTRVGSRWQSEECKFTPTKDNTTFIIDLKEKET
jgi:hypothetical protein